MKYCIYQDRPIVGMVYQGIKTAEVPEWAGCTIFNVEHKCKNCPNLVEMGDEPYSFSRTEDNFPYYGT